MKGGVYRILTCREALGDATLTNLDLLNLIGEMRKELEHDRICGH